jgi:ribosomal protein L37AE/L43A
MNIDNVLDQFEATLKNQIAQLQAAAKSAAPGGVGDWEAIVTHFGAGGGVPGIERTERLKQAGQRGHTRGAFPEEFEAVVAVLARQAGELLVQLGGWHQAALAADPAAAARIQALRSSVDQLATKQREAYEDGIKPRTGVGGLAGIFANASATSKLTPWANLQYDPQLTLACPSCGSPQRTRLVFNCEYCGTSLFEPKHSS